MCFKYVRKLVSKSIVQGSILVKEYFGYIYFGIIIYRFQKPDSLCLLPYLSIVSSLLLSCSSDSAIATSCCFSADGLPWVQSIHLNKPARDISMEPWSSSLVPAPFCRKPSRDFCLALRFASSASRFSCSSSWIIRVTMTDTWREPLTQGKINVSVEYNKILII